MLQTVDEQLDRMNEAEFKALLEACAHKTEKTLEQAAMFSVSGRLVIISSNEMKYLRTVLEYGDFKGRKQQARTMYKEISLSLKILNILSSRSENLECIFCLLLI